jgi:hypothetical protein
VQQSRNTNFPTMKALKLSYMLHKFKGKKFRELRYQFRELRYSTSKKISYVGNLNSPPPKKNLENTNQSHCRTKIEKINKRRISQSALGQKQFEQMSNGKNRLEK